MHLVVDQVMQFQHVDVSNRRFLFECVTRAAVKQPRLAMPRQTGFRQAGVDVLFDSPRRKPA